jgi:GNAT superfamily N-acetyltransferase
MGDFSDLNTNHVKERTCSAIAASGFESWYREYEERADLLTAALERYNNGRMKRFLCELFIQQDIESCVILCTRPKRCPGAQKESGKHFKRLYSPLLQNGHSFTKRRGETPMYIRRFNDADAEEVSNLVCRNFREVNIRDYPADEMERLAESYSAEKIRNLASSAHTYVAFDDNRIVGTGSITGYWGSETESVLLTIFVLPEYQRKGIGSRIVRALEADEYFLRASRIEIPASITACEFYIKMGYCFKDGKKELDDEGHYKMEKFR